MGHLFTADQLAQWRNIRQRKRKDVHEETATGSRVSTTRDTEIEASQVELSQVHSLYSEELGDVRMVNVCHVVIQQPIQLSQVSGTPQYLQSQQTTLMPYGSLAKPGPNMDTSGINHGLDDTRASYR